MGLRLKQRTPQRWQRGGVQIKGYMSKMLDIKDDGEAQAACGGRTVAIVRDDNRTDAVRYPRQIATGPARDGYDGELGVAVAMFESDEEMVAIMNLPVDMARAFADNIYKTIAEITAKGGVAPATYQEGAIAANPKTGERLVFRTGEWKPLR